MAWFSPNGACLARSFNSGSDPFLNSGTSSFTVQMTSDVIVTGNHDGNGKSGAHLVRPDHDMPAHLLPFGCQAALTA